MFDGSDELIKAKFTKYLLLKNDHWDALRHVIRDLLDTPIDSSNRLKLTGRFQDIFDLLNEFRGINDYGAFDFEFNDNYWTEGCEISLKFYYDYDYNVIMGGDQSVKAVITIMGDN